MAKTKKELESELEACVIDYNKRIDRLLEIQRDYERRMDFFHTAVSMLTESYIGTWDLGFALDQFIKFGFAEPHNVGEKLAELYSINNEGCELPYLNNRVCDMVYQAACEKLWAAIPYSEECVDYTQESGCYTEFQTCGNSAAELEQFAKEVEKMKSERPDDFKDLRGILEQVFKDLDMKESFDFVSKKE